MKYYKTLFCSNRITEIINKKKNTQDINKNLKQGKLFFALNLFFQRKKNQINKKKNILCHFFPGGKICQPNLLF